MPTLMEGGGLKRYNVEIQIAVSATVQPTVLSFLLNIIGNFRNIQKYAL